ncbi:MAG: transposase, family [Clostridia bacterium]|nr:transposase, family [Clostridia bacterium]
MYIRQKTFLSFGEILNFQPQTRLEKVFYTLDLCKILKLLPKSKDVGRKGYSEEAMFLALIAMRIEDIKTVVD